MALASLEPPRPPRQRGSWPPKQKHGIYHKNMMILKYILNMVPPQENKKTWVGLYKGLILNHVLTCWNRSIRKQCKHCFSRLCPFTSFYHKNFLPIFSASNSRRKRYHSHSSAPDHTTPWLISALPSSLLGPAVCRVSTCHIHIQHGSFANLQGQGMRCLLGKGHLGPKWSSQGGEKGMEGAPRLLTARSNKPGACFQPWTNHNYVSNYLDNYAFVCLFLSWMFIPASTDVVRSLNQPIPTLWLHQLINFCTPHTQICQYNQYMLFACLWYGPQTPKHSTTRPQ